MTKETMKIDGKCSLCNKLMSEKAMRTHIKKCAETHKTSNSDCRSTQRFYLAVKGSDFPMYWLHLEAPAANSLQQLDSFLRDIWLECCGHLSCFTIEGVRYSSYPCDDDELVEEEGMHYRLSKVLRKGLKFSYEYDFGSTTCLDLHVVDTWQRREMKPEIKLLARNQSPAWECANCGKPGVWIEACGFGLDLEMVLCNDCTDQAEEPECLLPLVNSPRTGVCGYDG